MSRATTCLLLLFAACAHRPAVEIAREERVWPPPPARPLVRFLESFPREDREPERAPLWRRLVVLKRGQKVASHHRREK